MMARPCSQMRVGCRRGISVRICDRRSRVSLCEFPSVCPTSRYHNLYPTSQSIVHLEIVQATGLISLCVYHESINTIDSNHISIAVLLPALGRSLLLRSSVHFLRAPLSPHTSPDHVESLQCGIA